MLSPIIKNLLHVFVSPALRLKSLRHMFFEVHKWAIYIFRFEIYVYQIEE